jgi:hypothetical protein
MVLRTAAIALGLALIAAPALADGASEAVTAETHAELAAQASDLNGVHMHLHHTINCLVGPAGKGFDAQELNPCANAGNGAIPDTTDTTRKIALQNAVAEAQLGIDSSDLTEAKKDATQTASMLKAK